MNVLVVGAHPDDEIIGVGGTLRKHVIAGDHVSIHILTDGHSSREGDSEDARLTIANRRAAALHSAKLLGVTHDSLILDSFPDQYLETVPLVKLVKRIEEISRRVNPDVVYFHHHSDANYDHQVVFRACLTAFRSTGQRYPKELLTFETLSSTEWGTYSPSSAFVPNYFVNIEETFHAKLEAMECYREELREYPHPRSIRGLEISARRWGSVIGVNFAEAFCNIRRIWL